MTRMAQRRWSLLFFFLFFFDSGLCLWGQSKALSTASESSTSQYVASPGEPTSRRIPPGAEQVTQARTILDRLEPRSTSPKVATTDGGALGLAWYYLKSLFALLLWSGSGSSGSASKLTKVQQVNAAELWKALKLLEEADAQGNTDATYLLADTAFYGKYGSPRNYTLAFQNYEALAERNGNASAQQMIGFMHATGIGNVVQQDQAKALLYNTFAADAGDIRAQMTTAYRHHAGIGTPNNCEKAVHYYQKVAEKAIEYMYDGPPGGRRLVKESYRVVDDVGGVYGEGASSTSVGPNAQKSFAADSDQNLDNYLEYLDIMSKKGDLGATFRLGQYYYDGSRVLKPDYKAAKEIFLDIARRYWSRDGKIKPDTSQFLERVASKAASYLGSMFLRGEGMEPNFNKARVWFRRGIENGDENCQYQMGLMYLYGLGVDADAVKASEYFGAAADKDHTLAQVRLGALMIDQGELSVATRYFELAGRHNAMEAFYYLAELANQGLGRDRSCQTAAHFYKIVAEKAESLHSSFGEANELYEAGDIEGAFAYYLQAAEQGYEAAQANVAHILDNTSRSYLTPLHSFFPSVFTYTSVKVSEAALALTYWTRSAKQANVDSLVKMGDYYLTGLGSQTSGSKPPSASPHEAVAASSFTPAPDKAAACYSAAAETQMSAQALWNLGWMYENGLGGMAQDFHLAKRYYDQSLETNVEAYLPVTLALFKLRLRSWWNGVSGGKAKGISDSETDKPRRSLTDWFNEFLLAELGALDEEMAQQERMEYDEGGADEWDTATAMGDEALYDDLITDQFFEALMFAVLAAGLAVLVWYRQLVRHRQQGEAGNNQQNAQNQQAANAPANQEAQQRQERNRGGFPRPGDPDFGNWAAGGVGH